MTLSPKADHGLVADCAAGVKSRFCYIIPPATPTPKT